MRPVLGLAVVGLLGFTFWKVARIFFVPLFMMLFKIALVIGLVMLVMWWFQKNKKDKKDGEAPAE